MTEKIIYAQDLCRKLNLNFIECSGSFDEIKHIFNPIDKTFIRFCMNPEKCFFRKTCRALRKSQSHEGI